MHNRLLHKKFHAALILLLLALQGDPARSQDPAAIPSNRQRLQDLPKGIQVPAPSNPIPSPVTPPSDSPSDGPAGRASEPVASGSSVSNPPDETAQMLDPNSGLGSPLGSNLANELGFDPMLGGTMGSELTGTRLSETDALSVGLNFNEFPKDYVNGLTLQKGRWALKFGGYVKADLLRDFRAIDSTDTFDPATIPIGDPQRTNTRMHARQSRLNMDARWITNTGNPLRIMVEGDFFGSGDTFRLRHAFGEYEGLIVGQTWTTFTHRAALPNTLDVVGDVASVGRRQAQVRYSRHFFDDRWVVAAAIEDSNVTVDPELLAFGQPRSIAPDFISRLRYNGDRGQWQIAGLVRRLGFQPTGQDVLSDTGSGLNLTGFFDLAKRCRLYGGILWGKGIGNYRDLPDAALIGPGEGTTLETLAWSSGVTHQWNPRWSTNLTYSSGNVDNTPGQPAESIHRLEYIAVNLIWQPNPYMFAGSELLWGERMDADFSRQDASRLMFSFGFLFP
jgi:hypothetical protein